LNKKTVVIEVSYDTEETWEETYQEVKEILQMINNLKRNAVIKSIKGDNHDDGQNE